MLVMLLYISIAALMPFSTLRSQEAVAPCTDWLATVDEATQQIVLRWRPSADSTAMGYHICTGSPCIDYDTVFGRLDTTYTCSDHSALEPHRYRLHVFDTAYNVSSLTPSFGNIVLHAEAPECATSVDVSWTPYIGMPEGVASYRLLAMLEPYDTAYTTYYTTSPGGTFACTVELGSGVTHVHLKVQAFNNGYTLMSQSNVVSFERPTIDTATYVDIVSISFDSTNDVVRLLLDADTSYHADHYTLWRSVDARPWQALATLPYPLASEVYLDNSINLYDSLHCYQLSTFDGCGLNEKFSATACIVVPDPPEPGMALPNIIIAGDPDNGAFLPKAVGLDGETYNLTIYNRMGLQVFTTDNPTDAWRPASTTPQGAYTYVLRVRYMTGIVKSYVGTVVVIK